ncbi:hypothetical protein BT69DRAFT_1284809 [Atractiella rhizophila]|nr:hypothetical protein BT69DRAFT_1284809 [Atractiella rhizophila]
MAQQTLPLPAVGAIRENDRALGEWFEALVPDFFPNTTNWEAVVQEYFDDNVSGRFNDQVLRGKSQFQALWRSINALITKSDWDSYTVQPTTIAAIAFDAQGYVNR